MDAAAASTTVNASRDAIERVESIDVRGYAIAPNNSQGYHIVYTTPIEGGGFGARHLFYDGSQAHFDSYVSSPIMSVEQSMLGVSEYSHIATVYFSGYQGGAQVYLTNQADFSDAIQALANPADGIKNVNHSTSDQSPGKYATQTTVFDPGLSLGAPGEIRLVFSNQNENDFDLRSVIPAIDISVSGGGAVWDAIENTALNADARVLTLGYSAGRLTAGLPVTVEIKKVKNPTQAGSYVFAIQEGAARFSEPASSYSVTSAVADNIIKINAIVLPPSG